MRSIIWNTTDGFKGINQGYAIALGGMVLHNALHLGGFDTFENIIDNMRLIEIVQMYPSRSKLFATL